MKCGFCNSTEINFEKTRHFEQGYKEFYVMVCAECGAVLAMARTDKN